MTARTLRTLAALLATAVLLAACGSTSPWPPDAFLVGGVRPAVVVPPIGHDPAVPTPLIVVLHGYQSSALDIERTFPLASGAAVAGALVVRPEGVRDTLNRRFWNAAAACCDLFGFAPDDEAYLLALLDEIEARVAVSEVLLFGHSNGGFMAYALACRHPERFAAVVSIAGALDDPPPTACGAGGPPNVLHIHGTRDRIVDYEGGRLVFNLLTLPPYTGAEATVEAFAAGAGCGAFAPGPRIDFDAGVEGEETLPFEADCPEGRRVALWRIDGGGHEPTVRADFAARLLRFARGE